MAFENMRREARIEARVPVVMHRGKRTVSLETSDVSFKGLFLCTADPPPLRSLVRLIVSLDGATFETHAMAVHIVRSGGEHDREAGVGLQFWGLSGPARTAWDDYVRGLVQARRAAAKKQAMGSDTATPSGIRVASAAASSPASVGPASSPASSPAPSSPRSAPGSSPYGAALPSSPRPSLGSSPSLDDKAPSSSPAASAADPSRPSRPGSAGGGRS